MNVSPASSDEVMSSGPSSPVQAKFKSYQELLKRVASSFDIQIEMVQESPHILVDILNSADLSRVALPINEAILAPTVTLYKSPTSLPPTAKSTGRSVMSLLKGTSSFKLTLPQDF